MSDLDTAPCLRSRNNRAAIMDRTVDMMRMVNRFCQIPGATFTLRFDGVALLGAYGMLFLIIGFLRSKKNGFLFAALFLLLLLLCRQIIKG